MSILYLLQRQISDLPTYPENNKWYIRKDIFMKLWHFKYMDAKAVRKAKARRKRLRAKCSG